MPSVVWTFLLLPFSPFSSGARSQRARSTNWIRSIQCMMKHANMQYFLQVRALREISPHFHHPCLHFFALFCTFVAGARSQRAPHLLLHLHRLLAPALPWPRRLWRSKLQGHQRGDGPKVDNDSLLRYQKPKLYPTSSGLPNIWASLFPRASPRTTWRRNKSQGRPSSLARWSTSSRGILRSSMGTRSRNQNRFSTQRRRWPTCMLWTVLGRRMWKEWKVWSWAQPVRRSLRRISRGDTRRTSPSPSNCSRWPVSEIAKFYNAFPQEQSKFGGAEFAAQYQEALLRDIQEKFDYFQKLNDSKIQNLFYQAKEGYVFRCFHVQQNSENFLKKPTWPQDLNKFVKIRSLN